VAPVRILIGCVFVGVVTESETYGVYEMVFQTIKVSTHNLSRASNFIA
jgi:hypothetical protein